MRTRFRNIFIILFALIAAHVMFRVVLPWFSVHLPSWWITFLLGVIAVFAIYVWVVGITLAGILIPKWFVRLMIVLLLIHYGWSFLKVTKLETVKALEGWQRYSGLVVADKIDRKYPITLARADHDLNVAMLEKEQEGLAGELNEFQRKVEKGERLTPVQLERIKEVHKKLLLIKRDLSQIDFVDKAGGKSGKIKLISSLDPTRIRFVRYGERVEVNLVPDQLSSKFVLLDLGPGKKFKIDTGTEDSRFDVIFMDHRRYPVAPDTVSVDFGKHASNAQFWLQGQGVAVITYQ